jgi:hypothetical protein
VPEDVSILEDLGIIRVDSYGAVTEGDLIASMEDVVAIGERRGITRVFVDASRATSMPGESTMNKFGSALSERATAIKVAVVASERAREGFGVLGKVVQRRGMPYRLFDSSGDAIAWLRE